jgi:hypothetical protein
VTTAAATTARVQALHPSFAAVTSAQIDAVWVEVVQRSGATSWGDTLGTAYALMAAHLIALSPSGATGSGVGLVTTSSSSSGLSITRHIAAASPANGDLDQTVWGQRWVQLVESQPALSAPQIYF